MKKINFTKNWWWLALK